MPIELQLIRRYKCGKVWTTNCGNGKMWKWKAETPVYAGVSAYKERWRLKAVRQMQGLVRCTSTSSL